MKNTPRWRHELIPRFIAVYLLVLVLPCTLLCVSVYDGAMRSARSELIRMWRDAAYSDRLYLENQLQNIAGKVNQFKKRSSLSDILDGTYYTDKNVMYQYVKEVGDLIRTYQDQDEHINRIVIYTSNETASRILPSFRPMSELYEMPLTKAFRENSRQELFRRFWVAQTVDGKLTLTYYAGLMNSLFQRINGVLAIECDESLFDFFLKDNAEETATYVFMDQELIYEKGAAPAGGALLQRLRTDHDSSSGDTVTEIDEENGLLINTLRLANDDIIVVQISPLAGMPPLPIGFWLAVLLFALLSTLLFLTVFHPVRSIASLSRHMMSTQTATLAPYPGRAGKDEVGDLIREYNAMVERTTALSQAVHQNELLLRNAQIEMLQSQINPHFFYGTLENIRMVAEMHGEALIADIAYEFGQLMRYSLSREFFVPLSKEVQVVTQYLEIQQKRLGGRFVVEWRVNADMEGWNCPKFVLFSMVENVFTHDVNHTRRVVRIVLSISEEGDELRVSVENDGPGVDAERLASLRHLIAHPEEREHFASNHNGRSIFNISDRLRLYYGSHYAFTIDSEPDKRTVCSVLIHRTARAVEREESPC